MTGVVNLHLHQITNLLILIFLLTHSVSARAINCKNSPDLNCLLATAHRALSETPEDESIDEVWMHLQFELDQQNLELETPVNVRADEYIALKKALQMEERFLALLNRSQIGDAQKMLADLPRMLQDLNHPRPEYLLIEFMILNLQDDEAEQTKRDLYKSFLDNKQAMIEEISNVARYEILGGAPQKGRQTLSNASIDGFSNPLLFQSKHITETLAERSEALFLNPSHLEQDCWHGSKPMARSFYESLTQTELNWLQDLVSGPDTNQNIVGIVDLANLYQNGEKCPLNSIILTHWLIQSLTWPDSTIHISLLDLIFTARSIRRYVSSVQSH